MVLLMLLHMLWGKTAWAALHDCGHLCPWRDVWLTYMTCCQACGGVDEAGECVSAASAAQCLKEIVERLVGITATF